MKSSEAKALFLQIAADFFDGYTVIFANQSRIAKPTLPLVTILPGNIKRPQAASHRINDDGIMIGYYLSKLTITVDLFTHGTAITDDDGEIVAYENTAVDEMLAFADYLNSPKGVTLCDEYDVSILIESDVQDLTGAVNDNNYEYRSRQEILFYFTQETDSDLGDMGVFENISISEES